MSNRRLNRRTPAYRLHKATGQAVVTLNGQDHYLGIHGTDSSRVRYDQLVAQWLAHGRQLPPPVQPDRQGMLLADLMLKYWQHCQSYYRKNGRQTSEVDCIRTSLRFLRPRFSSQHIEGFGPLSLKAVRQRMVAQGLSRGTVNKYVNRIVRMFKWGVSEELVSETTYRALATVEGLAAGRTAARETQPVTAVPIEVVQKTLPQLSHVVTAMVQLQMATGMRPGEVCTVRPCDVDRTGDVWLYTPATHKTQHHKKQRVVAIGPAGQAALAPFLLRAADAFCFSPLESFGKQKGKRIFRDCFDSDTYRRAIHRACDRAFEPAEELTFAALAAWQSAHRWSPNQLRHYRACSVRETHGLEGAQAVLGHSTAKMTEHYAEASTELAKEIAKWTG